MKLHSRLVNQRDGSCLLNVRAPRLVKPSAMSLSDILERHTGAGPRKPYSG